MYLTSWMSLTVTLPHSRQPQEQATYSLGHSPWRESQQILFLKVNFWLFTPALNSTHDWALMNKWRQPQSPTHRTHSTDPKRHQKTVFYPQTFALLGSLWPQDVDTWFFLPDNLSSLSSQIQQQRERINICKKNFFKTTFTRYLLCVKVFMLYL